ncbi:MAG: cell division protein FtsL [Hoeflea sp.]|uniref:cell division protein FtsL n=1 Tax=Hoeflea sp. TaxID=1940281 RepID=UPI003EF72B88
MLRTIDLVLVCAMIAAATITYQIKHAAEEKLTEVRELQSEISLQEDTIDLLEADWSLLNQPSRLQRLSTAFEAELGLKPIAPEQMAEPDELPGSASDFEPLVAESATDTELTTGSVQR